MWGWYFPSELWLIVWAVDTFVVASFDAGVLSEVSLDKGKAQIYTFSSSTITIPFLFPSQIPSKQCMTKECPSHDLIPKIHNLRKQVVITDKLSQYCHCELLADLGDWHDVADAASDNWASTWTTIADCKSGEIEKVQPRLQAWSRYSLFSQHCSLGSSTACGSGSLKEAILEYNDHKYKEKNPFGPNNPHLPTSHKALSPHCSPALNCPPAVCRGNNQKVTKHQVWIARLPNSLKC